MVGHSTMLNQLGRCKGSKESKGPVQNLDFWPGVFLLVVDLTPHTTTECHHAQTAQDKM